MIYLHTGLPGAGKTLMTLAKVRERAKAENRTVYYHGIEILKPEEFPGWQELADPAKWYELPDGAIVVHDECQTLYRPRGNGAQVPEHVARFETHRHKGHDVYLITQHPMLLDSNVRRLTGEHAHVVRAFGAKFATIHKWPQVKEQCDKTRGDSMTEQFVYPAALFSAYKSATVHTHKFKLPGRIWLLAVIPILLAVCAWVAASWMGKQADSKVPEAITGTTPGATVSSAAPPRTGGPKPLADWIAEQRPRIDGLPHTAPVYDSVTEVVRAPYPAACIASVTKCKCYTEQGTVLDTPEPLCRQIAETGYFVAWDTGRGRERSERGDRERRDTGTDLERVSDRQRAGYPIPSSSWGGVPPV